MQGILGPMIHLADQKIAKAQIFLTLFQRIAEQRFGTPPSFDFLLQPGVDLLETSRPGGEAPVQSLIGLLPPPRGRPGL